MVRCVQTARSFPLSLPLLLDTLRVVGLDHVHPDHVGYATLRPTNMAEFDALWGAICSTNGANGRGCPVPAFSDSLTVNRRT